MAIPATASTPMLSSQSMSSCVVTPPAAVTSRVVAFRTAAIASRSIPCMSPSTSTLVKRNSPTNGSSDRMASTGVIVSRVLQPSITTCPPRASTAAISFAAPRRFVMVSANSRSSCPPRKSDDPTMTFRAPPSSSAAARSIDLTPPPTRQGRRPQIDATSALLSPLLFAASRSINWIFGNRSNFRTQPSTSSVDTARRSPCTS